MTANKEQQVVVVSEFEVGRVDGVNADASTRIIVSEGLCRASEGKPDSTRNLKKICSCICQKVSPSSADCGEWINLQKP